MVGAADLSVLPPVLVDALFALLFEAWELDQVAHVKLFSYLPSAITSFVLVSKQWHAVFDERISARLLGSFTLNAQLATRSSVLELRRCLVLRGPYIKHLTVGQLPPFGVAGSSHWAAALRHVRFIESLDIGAPHVSSIDRVGEFVRAAAQQCPRIYTLALPDETSFQLRRQPRVDFVRTIIDAIETWHGNGGGLRFLRGSLAEASGGYQQSVEFVDKLIRFCPNVAVMDTWKASRSITLRKEQWLLDLATWTRFCETCTQMEEFNWYCVPFATKFFEVFGQTLKPRLRKLTLSTPIDWDWQRHLNECDAETVSELTVFGYGATAIRPQTILRSCPQLEELRVLWRQDASNIYGDDFILDVVTHCPNLRRLIVREVDAQGPKTVTDKPISTLTNEAIIALAMLPHLVEVELCTYDITAESLYHLVVGSDSRPSVAASVFRTYRIGVAERGDGMLTQDAVFTRALVGFLELLAAREEPFSRDMDKVSLWLVQHSPTVGVPSKGSLYSQQLVLLTMQIQSNHPGVELTINEQSRAGGSDFICEVASFGFQATGGGTNSLPHWCSPPVEWRAGISARRGRRRDCRIDSVFVLRSIDPVEDEDDFVD